MLADYQTSILNLNTNTVDMVNSIHSNKQGDESSSSHT